MGPEDGEFPEDADGHRECRQEIDRLTRALAGSEARAEKMREAIGIFFHHWKHGGIARDNQFHRQTAYALQAAITTPPQQ